MDTINQINEKLVLSTFFYELKEQDFTLSINKNGKIIKIDSFETMLQIYDMVTEITFCVRRGDYNGRAVFTFGNTEFGIFCMYTKSDSLKPFIVNTIAVIADLAQNKHKMRELEQQIKTKEKGNLGRLSEWVVIQKTINYLTKNGFLVKNTDGSALNMGMLYELHERSYDSQFNGTKNTGTKKESICLDVIDADYQDGYIQFTVGNGFYNVITGYSRNLTFHVNYINFLVYSGKLIKGDQSWQ